MSCCSRDTAFEIRERAGPDLKSSLKFLLTLDKRDLVTFPTNGPFIQLTSELAGLGGDVGFLKNELRLEFNKTLIQDYVNKMFITTLFIMYLYNNFINFLIFRWCKALFHLVI